MLLAVYFYGVIFGMLMGFMAFVSLLFAPVGATVTAVMAYRRGTGTIRYAAAGLWYGMSFIVPLVFFVARIAGRRPPVVVVVVSYLSLYTVWICFSIVGGYLIMWTSGTDVSGILSEGKTFHDLGTINVWYGWVTLANIGTLVASLIWLMAGHFLGSRNDKDHLIPAYYVAPFWFPAFWSAFALMTFLT